MTKKSDPKVAIDFDETIMILKGGGLRYPEFGEPIPGAREALKAIKDTGYKILIYSCRTSSSLNDDDSVHIQSKKIKDWLNKHDIPFDSIWMGTKPRVCFFIDDNAVRFENNWPEITTRLETYMAEKIKKSVAS